MSKPDLSIIAPSIRPYLLEGMYDSIFHSTKRDFELIIVSPYPLPERLQKAKNVKLVKDWGNPTRCSNIGLLVAEGRYIYGAHSDDAIFIEDSLDDNLTLFEAMGDNEKNALVCKYSESKDFSNKNYQDDRYYQLNVAYQLNPHIIPDKWLIFNSVFLHHSYILKLGGWDARFQVPAIAHADLAARAQFDGANVQLSPYPSVNVDHMEGTSGDHASIHLSQCLEDMPNLQIKYNSPIQSDSILIDVNNWKNTPSVWTRRFSDG